MAEHLNERCCNMRPPKRSKLLPGQQTWKRCRNAADLMVSVHQCTDRIGSGWFEIPLCDACFKEGQVSR